MSTQEEQHTINSLEEVTPLEQEPKINLCDNDESNHNQCKKDSIDPQDHNFINKDFFAKYNLGAAFQRHKEKMITVYTEQNKTLFDSQGYTICPVIGQRIGIQHVLNPDRCNPLGIQLGHVLPRSNTRHTIRGFNLVLMTRTGNRLVGEHDFNSQDWLEILRSTVAFHSSHV